MTQNWTTFQCYSKWHDNKWHEFMQMIEGIQNKLATFWQIITNCDKHFKSWQTDMTENKKNTKGDIEVLASKLALKNLVEKVNIYNQQLNIWRNIWRSIFDRVERLCLSFFKTWLSLFNKCRKGEITRMITKLYLIKKCQHLQMKNYAK